ncbi:hypothetical protein LCGC14_1822150, partial [marine sediment metagenome]
MRKLKFRAWCDDCKVMFKKIELNPPHVVYTHDGDGSMGFAHYNENNEWHVLIPIQYTGLKDSQGE